MKIDIQKLKNSFKDTPNRTRGDFEAVDGDVKPGPTHRDAAVMILIVPHAKGYTIVLTKRAEDLPHHPGQVSFPGGKVEDADTSICDTALRETQEELGIDPKDVDIIGTLDTYITRTGFKITPVVAMAKGPLTYTPDPSEVDAVFELPISLLMNPDSITHEKKDFKGQTYRFVSWEYDGFRIWGATAFMLKNLTEHLEAQCPPKTKTPIKTPPLQKKRYK